MIIIEREFRRTRLVREEALSGIAFTGEDGGHKFIVRVKGPDGEAETLTGHAVGKFIREDGVTVELTESEGYAGIDGDGRAWVVLAANCYTDPGPFRLIITNVAGDDTRTCVAAFAGYVMAGETGEIVDPGSVINVDAIVSMIDELQDAIQDAQEQATSSVQFTAQSLTDAQKAQARTNIGAGSEADVSDLKSAIEDTAELSSKGTFDIIVSGTVVVPYETINCTISATNYAAVDGTRYRSYQIPADNYYGLLTMTANDAKTAVVTFLKMAIPSDIANNADITSYLATGETGRHTVASGTTASFTIPDDTKYLFISSVSTSAFVKPTTATVTSGVKSEINRLSDRVDDLSGILINEVTFTDLWESGGWASQAGAPTDNVNRIRTKSGRLTSFDYIVKSDSGVVFWPLFYNGSGSLVPISSYAARTECDIASIAPEGAAEFRLVARTDPESDISAVVAETGAKIHFFTSAVVNRIQGEANAQKFLRVNSEGLVVPNGAFDGPFRWTQRVLGLRMAADANGVYFIPFNACGQGVARGNGLHGDDYYRDNIHPTQLGAYNIALGIWSRLKSIPCWFAALPSTHTQPMDGSQWQGKTWYAYGTSLTQGTVSNNKYANFVAEFSGMTLVNKGYGGGALVTNRQIYNRLLDMTDGKLNADLITIEVGANDSGELGDPWSLDTNTFFGALNYCIKSMFEGGIQAQVVVMASTPGRYLSTDSSVKFDVNRLYNT